MITPERAMNFKGLKFLGIKLDPATIKDRWGLAALFGILWVVTTRARERSRIDSRTVKAQVYILDKLDELVAI